MIKQFYEKVLPSQGIYCVASISKSDRTTHRFVDSFSDLTDAIEELKNEGQNVFVALNSFKGHSRKADYAMYCKSFFIDLDVGDGDRKYKSKQEALEALDVFIKLSELPPPVRIDSGGGLHAYWILDRDVPTAEWKIYATKFKQLCQDYLKIDPAVTADAARILRCPNTLNYKKDLPTQTKFLDTEFVEYDFDMFKDFLGEAQPKVVSIVDLIPKGLDEDTKKIARLDNFETIFQEVAEKSLSGQGCNQIKHALINAATLEEPIWYAALSIARHCTDWETAIHLMSEDHPTYNYEGTIKKANQAFGKPFSCDKFEELNPKGCEGCSFKGRITNPLAIGRKLIEAEANEADTGVNFLVTQNVGEVPVFPQSLRPYVRGKAGGIYYLPPTELSDDGVRQQPDPILISKHDFFPIRRTYGRLEGENYTVCIVMPHETREISLPHEATQNVEDFKRILGKAGISPPVQVHWSKLADYMTKWASYLQEQEPAKQIRGQMGWTADNSAFVIGNIEITKSGETRDSAISPLVRGVANMFTPKGSYEKWQECINKLNLPEFEMHAFAVGMAFASPLMRFSATSGMSYCYTGNTGGAKTGGLIAAVSVFGSSRELAIFKTTDNGFVMRSLSLKNIFIGLDETKDKDPKEISNLIHSVSQGKGKIRMHSSITAEREQELTSAHICLMTSNESMRDKLFTTKRNPTGEMARYMEFRILRPKILDLEDSFGEDTFDPFNSNYGWAGPIYIKHLMKVGDAYIEEVTAKWAAKLKASKFGKDVSFRFFFNSFIRCFAGLELASEAGILNYDLERIFDRVLLQAVIVKNKTIKDSEVDYKSLVTEFCYKYQTGLLFFNNGLSTTTTYGSIVARIEIDTGMIYLSKTPFCKFLIEECRVSTEEWETALKKDNILTDRDSKDKPLKRRLTTGWEKGPTLTGVACYAIKTSLPDEVLNKINKDAPKT